MDNVVADSKDVLTDMKSPATDTSKQLECNLGRIHRIRYSRGCSSSRLSPLNKKTWIMAIPAAYTRYSIVNTNIRITNPLAHPVGRPLSMWLTAWA